MIKDTIVDGFQNAAHRSLYHALGLTKEEQARPLIGIVNTSLRLLRISLPQLQRIVTQGI